jgi:hypothetical protein
MCDSARLYNCAHCQQQVIICSHCDHGNIYCTDGCAEQSRQEKQREAADRYQNTPNGRHLHAQRQQRYRQRKKTAKEKVTHRGSLDQTAYGSITAGQKAETTQQNNSDFPKKEGIFCHFCGCQCSEHLRWSFLHRQSRMVLLNSVF